MMYKETRLRGDWKQTRYRRAKASLRKLMLLNQTRVQKNLVRIYLFLFSRTFIICTLGSSIAKTVTRKDGPKQATLFGMMSKTTPLQKKNENSASETQTTQIDSQTTDSQSSDVLMSDVGHLDAASTQEDSQQRAFSPDWDIEDDSL